MGLRLLLGMGLRQERRHHIQRGTSPFPSLSLSLRSSNDTERLRVRPGALLAQCVLRLSTSLVISLSCCCCAASCTVVFAHSQWLHKIISINNEKEKIKKKQKKKQMMAAKKKTKKKEGDKKGAPAAAAEAAQ